VHDVSGLRTAFRKTYGTAAEPFVCRAPGRVNIIGEHTDYNGLPVLPMTIDQDIRIAFTPRADNRVRMRNALAAFTPQEFINASAIPPSPPRSWDNYCKAALQGVNRHFRIKQPVGMDMLVSGTIPISAGLSSSSALVVACALAYLRRLDRHLEQDVSRLTLAALLAEAEHYVGTKGGGMDQAIILLGEAGGACKIDFFPLRVERIPLPRGHVFVVCDSLVKAEKTGEALHRYNAGPRLCRLACALVARQARREFGEEVEIRRIGDLWNGHLCLTDAEVKDLFDKTFRKETTALAEAAAELGLSVETIRGRWLGELKEPAAGFPLKARARHQFTEQRRVETARDALVSGDAEALGKLMDESHESCARDYEISCPELEALVGIARDSGAAGARLTGAGFGGCIVSLVPAATLGDFLVTVRRRYYQDYLGGRAVVYTHDPVFTVHSSAAAGYL
jgi:N-acetylgalactosamine kinase